MSVITSFTSNIGGSGHSPRSGRSWRRYLVGLKNIYLISFLAMVGLYRNMSHIITDETTGKWNGELDQGQLFAPVLDMEVANTLDQSQIFAPVLDMKVINTDTHTIPRQSFHDEAPNEEKQGHNVDTKTIRRWGCSRNETPFIFVHIGKAGGGEVRRMIAAAASDYKKPRKRAKRRKILNQRRSYFRIYNDVPNTTTTTLVKGQFMNGRHKNHRPKEEFYRRGTMEGSRQCDAETPIGQALMCPGRSQCTNSVFVKEADDDYHDPNDGHTNSLAASCHLVYTGHNLIGSEMHWLPYGYLRRWWDSKFASGKIPSWEDIPGWSECGEYDTQQRVPFTSEEERCRTDLGRKADSFAGQAFSSAYGGTQNAIGEMEHDSIIIPSWSPIYASLPVLRVTMTREPFSWLASKFAWHKLRTLNLTHDNIEEMTRRPNSTNFFLKSVQNTTGAGWANNYAFHYIMSLCGEDCLVRYAHGYATLDDLVRQAEENLRHSFAVVGLLTDTESFYDMISARVAYMSNLTKNAHLSHEGGQHTTSSGRSLEVKKTYADPKFQRRLLDASPEIAALLRLYEVSVEVNRFQLKELSSCPSWNISGGRN